MKRTLIQRIVDYFFSHEEQLNTIIANFQKTQKKLVLVNSKIEAKIAQEQKQIADLNASIANSTALSIKNTRISRNFSALLGEEPVVEEKAA